MNGCDNLVAYIDSDKVLHNHKEDKIYSVVNETSFRDIFKGFKIDTDADNIVLIVELDSERVTYMSQGAMLYYGISDMEMELPAPEKLIPNWYKSLQSLRNLDGEVKVLRERIESEGGDGKSRVLSIELYGLKSSHGSYVIAVLNDISDKVSHNTILEKVFFSSPYAVVLLDREGNVGGINDNFKELFKYSEKDLKTNSLRVLAPKGMEAVLEKNLQESYNGKTVKQEGLRRTKDGKLVNVEILGYPIVYKNNVEGLYVLYVDITDKKNYQKHLTVFSEILENNREGVVIANDEGVFGWSNRAFRNLTGYGNEELYGKTYDMFLPDEVVNTKGVIWEAVKENGKWSGEVRFLTKSKLEDNYWLSIYTVNDGFDKKNYVGVLSGLIDKRESLDRFLLDEKDPLTGLLNRSSFIEMLNSEVKTCMVDKLKFALLSVDIDNFKDINDSLGHMTGDSMLVSLSVRISDILPENAYLSRFDGDEFSIILQYKDEHEVDKLAQKIKEESAIPYKSRTSTVYLKVNIGISLFPDHAQDAETMVRYSNIAMYRARDLGLDRICFYSPEMSNGVEENFFIANFLVEAIEKDELSMQYQPIVDIESGELKSIEALMRWNNSVLGQVPPDKFISVAEKTGQIIQIGEWGMTEVCRQIKQWKDSGIVGITISVNVSILQLEQPEFADQCISIAEKYHINPELIEMEITESVSTGDISQIVDNLRSLKNKGFSIAMDDFGTGFSSLGQLDMFELDKIKIDRIFIDKIVTDKKKQNLVKAIIAMAKSLNLSVVAEGIEDREQLAYLKTFGCNLGQGYFFSKPLQNDIMLEFYRNNLSLEKAL